MGLFISRAGSGAPSLTFRAFILRVMYPNRMIRIRRVLESDLEAIRTIINREIAENVAHFGLTETSAAEALEDWRTNSAVYPWFIAELDGVVVGFAKGLAWQSRGAYEWAVQISVYVKPDFQSRGVGTMLYTALIDKVRELGFRCVIGGIALPNDPSVRLHESLGMNLVGTFPCVGYKHGKWIDVAYWALTFDGDDPPSPIEGWKGS